MQMSLGVRCFPLVQATKDLLGRLVLKEPRASPANQALQALHHPKTSCERLLMSLSLKGQTNCVVSKGRRECVENAGRKENKVLQVNVARL